MKTKRIKAFLIAAIFAFESVTVGVLPLSAQTVSENSVKEATVADPIIVEESKDTEIENVPSETATIAYEGVDGDLSWSIDTAGHLTISGNGDYEERYYPYDSGWLAHKDEIISATVNVSGITDTSLMFYGCSGLTSLDVSGFTTSNVTDMRYMFQGCSGLTSLDVSAFNTSSVTDMEHMFYGCERLMSLDVSGFTTSNVTDMGAMFHGCSGLTSLDVSGFNTSNVTDMSGMFSRCSGLTSLDVSGFTTSNVTAMNSMFFYCSEVTSLEVSGFDTSNVTHMGAMFCGCSSLTSLDVSGFATSSVTDMGYMFDGCSSLTSLDVSGFDTSNVTNMGMMFCGCSGLTSLDISEFDTENVVEPMSNILNGEIMYYNAMYESCEKLTLIIAPENKSSQTMALPTDLNPWIYEPTGEIVTEITTAGNYVRSDVYDGTIIGTDGALSWCIDTDGHLTISGNGDYESGAWLDFNDKIETATVNVSGITSTARMFEWCESLQSVDLSGLDTSQVTSMHSMFYQCESLRSVDLSGFDTRNVTDMRCMFECCSALKSLDISGFDMSNVSNVNDVSNMSLMFFECDRLEKIIAPENKSEEIMSVPSVDNREDYTYKWIYEPTGEIVTEITKAGTYLRVSDDYTYETNSGGTNVGASTGIIKTPAKTGTQINAANLTGTGIPANSSFTVTSSDPKNPTVAFNGVNDENAAAVTIPATITYNGVTYRVTTVSIDDYTSKKDEAKYEVTSNKVGDLTIEYKAPTNKKKKTAKIPEYNTYKGIKFRVTSVAAKAFKGNKSLKNISIATSITKIGNDAFSGCKNLKTVTVGKSLETIGKNAFKSCKNLKKITIKSKKLKSVGKNALKGVNKKCKIKVPKAKVKAYKKLFKKKGQAKTVKITK